MENNESPLFTLTDGEAPIVYKGNITFSFSLSK